MVGLLQCKLACRSSEGVSFLTGEGRKRQGGQVVVTYCTAPCVCVCVYTCCCVSTTDDKVTDVS